MKIFEKLVVLLCATLLTVSCSLFNSGSGSRSSNTGSIHLTMNNSRTLLPTIDASKYTYAIKLTSDSEEELTGSIAVGQAAPSKTFSDISVGTWEVEVTAKLNGNVIASKTIGNNTVTKDNTTTVPVNLILKQTNGETGSALFSIEWGGASGLDSGELTRHETKLVKLSDRSEISITADELEFDSVNNTLSFDKTDLPSDHYLIVIDFYTNTSHRISVGEIIQIYDNMVSDRIDNASGADKSKITLTKEDFGSKPNNPASLVATEIVEGIKLTWEDKSNNEKNFILERKLTSEPEASWSLYETLDPGMTSYEDIKENNSDTKFPEVDKKYDYRLKAINNNGDSDYITNTDNSWSKPVPGDSGIITLTEGTPKTTSIKVNFTEATDGNSLPENLDYKVVYSTSKDIFTITDANINSNSGDKKLLTPGADGWNKIADLTLPLSATGLNDDTTYYFNILVKDEAGNISIYQTDGNNVNNSLKTVAAGSLKTDITIEEITAPTITFKDASSNQYVGMPTVTKGNTITFEIDGDFTTFKEFYIDNVLKSDSDAGISINGSTMTIDTSLACTIAKTYRLMVYVEKESKPFSKEITFQVEEV